MGGRSRGKWISDFKVPQVYKGVSGQPGVHKGMKERSKGGKKEGRNEGRKEGRKEERKEGRKKRNLP